MAAKLIRRGKVRDLYDLGDRLLLVASDRISAFDWILPTAIQDKGRILTQMSLFWFEFLGVPNHLISADVPPKDAPQDVDPAWLAGRSMIVKKCQVIPIECVARGYLAGSGWKEYQQSQTVCDVPLPAGLVESSQLPQPIFTPATKAEEGHDENISFEVASAVVGDETAAELRDRTLDLYRRGTEHAAKSGILLADTKFEFGVLDGEILLIDEVLTPDSSRYWPADDYEPGRSQVSYDKQIVRDWLESTAWDKNSPPPELPQEIVDRTRARYVEAYEAISAQKF
jgi:phosphoribosylaminoimidazole-succinocarboxamide synthase